MGGATASRSSRSGRITSPGLRVLPHGAARSASSQYELSGLAAPTAAETVMRLLTDQLLANALVHAAACRSPVPRGSQGRRRSAACAAAGRRRMAAWRCRPEAAPGVGVINAFASVERVEHSAAALSSRPQSVGNGTIDVLARERRSRVCTGVSRSDYAFAWQWRPGVMSLGGLAPRSRNTNHGGRGSRRAAPERDARDAPRSRSAWRS